MHISGLPLTTEIKTEVVIGWFYAVVTCDIFRIASHIKQTFNDLKRFVDRCLRLARFFRAAVARAAGVSFVYVHFNEWGRMLCLDAKCAGDGSQSCGKE